MTRNISSYPLTVVYVLQAPEARWYNKDETNALTKSVPLAANRLRFFEGNEFWVRCAAFHEVQL